MFVKTEEQNHKIVFYPVNQLGFLTFLKWESKLIPLTNKLGCFLVKVLTSGKLNWFKGCKCRTDVQ